MKFAILGTDRQEFVGPNETPVFVPYQPKRLTRFIPSLAEGVRET